MATDNLSEVEHVVQSWLEVKMPSEPFWSEGVPCLDYGLLENMLAVPIGNSATSQSGSLAKSLDLWCAREFVRAGFDEDAVWPRLHRPRVIDPEVLRALDWLASHEGIDKNKAAEKLGSADARVMGAVYQKQVDVGLSGWLSGPEMLVSTKTMGGSFGKNAGNRFEEAYGDVKNLRTRYPLTAHGFVFLARSTIFEEGAAFGKVSHMLQSLSQSDDVYDAVTLIVASWDDGKASSVRVLSSEEAHIPPDLTAEHFYQVLITKILAEAPVETHSKARELYTTGCAAQI